jgi:glycosyltransferase involved in cell wall biosynthesis
MRIAVYHNLTSGGAKRALHQTVRGLSERHRIDVYSLESADHDYCDLRPFASRHETVPFAPPRLFRSPLGRLNQLQRLRGLRELDRVGRHIARMIDDGNYDVVYVHPDMWTQAPMFLRHSGSQTLYHVHESLRDAYEAPVPRPYDNRGPKKVLDGIDPLIALYRSALKRLDYQATRRARRHLANSSFTAANLARNYGCTAEVAYFGLDCAAFMPASADSADADFVLSVGALVPRKGFDFLIQALGTIPQGSRPGLRIVSNFVDHRERAFLQQLAARESVRFDIENMVAQESLLQRYRQTPLVVYSPVQEPLGLVPLEAMACGTPVVAVADGGVNETVQDQVTGLLVPRDPHAFGEAVRSLLANGSRRRLYGRRGREYVCTHWDLRRALDKIEGHLTVAARN